MTDTTSKIYKAIKLFVLQEGKCHYCKVQLWNGGSDVMFCNIDHKTPVSRGGKNEMENYCLTCIPCNTEKGNMTEAEYVQYRLLAASGIPKKDLSEYVRFLELKKKFEGAGTPIVATLPLPELANKESK